MGRRSASRAVPAMGPCVPRGDAPGATDFGHDFSIVPLHRVLSLVEKQGARQRGVETVHRVPVQTPQHSQTHTAVCGGVESRVVASHTVRRGTPTQVCGSRCVLGSRLQAYTALRHVLSAASSLYRLATSNLDLYTCRNIGCIKFLLVRSFVTVASLKISAGDFSK